MPTLIVRHRIPVTNMEWAGPTVWFEKWIPEDETNALTRIDGNISTRLWTERSCVSSIEPVTDDYISKLMNIGVQCFLIDVIIADVPEELASFIYQERNSPKEEHGDIGPSHVDFDRLRSEYTALGHKVLGAALGLYNRLLAFARNHKGQYWIPLRPVNTNRMSSNNTEFRAKVQSEHFDWVRWCPYSIDHFIAYTPGRGISLTAKDWIDAQQFVAGKGRPDIVLELLANAQLLIDNGQRRSAIIEGVSALELALTRFSQAPDLIQIAEEFRRDEPGGLRKAVEHLGFTTSLRYLLPLLFRDLDRDVLSACIEAADVRNNVVHNGQRDVQEALIRPMIGNIRKACVYMAERTSKSTGET